MENMKTVSWESAEMFGFVDGIRLAWVRYEKAYRGGFEVADRQAVAIRDFDTYGPIASFSVGDHGLQAGEGR